MVVEPAKEDLVWRQTKKLLERLIVLQQAIQLGVMLDINLVEKTFANDLPNEAKDEVLPALNEVRSANVYDRKTERLRGRDDEVVVLGLLEGVDGFGAGGGCGRGGEGGRSATVRFRRGLVEHALVDRIGYRVVDELREDETVCLMFEQ